MGDGGWVELGGVRTPDGKGGSANLTIIGTGVVDVRVNWMAGFAVVLDGRKTVEVEWLRGDNVVILFQSSGTPFIDAIVVE